MVPRMGIAPREKKRLNGSFFVGRWKIRFRNKLEPLTAERRRWRCTCPKGGVERHSEGLVYKALLEFGMKSWE